MSKVLSTRDSNFEVIRSYVCEEDNSSIKLTEQQGKMLKRWNYYINKRLTRKHTTSEIIASMMKEFSIERATAYNDMGYAEALFGYSSTLDKRFRTGLRIDYLEEIIRELHDIGEYDAAARQEATLQRYYESYPDLNKNSSPKTIIFNITKNEYNNDQLPEVDDALMIINNHLPGNASKRNRAK